MISLYSQKMALEPQTNLLGVSSIASELATHSKDKYIAGLWQSNVLNNLLWYIDGTPSTRPNIYCAPSWSWASVDGTVHYLTTLNPSREFAKVLDTHVSLGDHNVPTGAITGGFIIFRGVLIEISAPNFFYIHGPLTAGHLCPDDPEDIIEDFCYYLSLRLQASALGDYLCGLVLRRLSRP